MWLFKALWVMNALWQTRHCRDFFWASWAGVTADMLMPGGRTTPESFKDPVSTVKIFKS